MSRMIQIKQLEEGFVVNDIKTTKEYAFSEIEEAILKIKSLFNITLIPVANVEKVNLAMTGEIKPERPVAEINPQSKIETTAEVQTEAKMSLGAIASQFIFKEIAAFEHPSIQPKRIKKTIFYQYSDKIRIMREGYGAIRIYTKLDNLRYLYEHPKEAEDIISAFQKATYANKAAILRAFLREVPFEVLTDNNTNNNIIVKAEKEFLGRVQIGGQKIDLKTAPESLKNAIVNHLDKGTEDGSCDDVTFEKCANNKPENCKYCVKESRFEDKRKLAAKLPSKPIMRIEMGPAIP